MVIAFLCKAGGSLLDVNCAGYSTFTEVEECIENNTFSEKEIIDHVAWFDMDQKSINPHWNITWIGEMTDTYFGKCFTLNQSIAVDPQIVTIIAVNASWDAKLYIHDPHFFLLTWNPQPFQRRLVSLSTSERFTYYLMELFRHVNLKRTSNPCEEDPMYSFTACVRNSISRAVGCRC